MSRRLLAPLAALALLAATPAAAASHGLPALDRDPPTDARHPASGGGVQFESHGAKINAQLYRPAGEGPHPTVILFHGLPGNEQNLDLARVLQRAGWTVITFHYRGSWGSGGDFHLKGGVEDGQALLAELQNPERAHAWGVDPTRLVVVGHSYGGYVAARLAAETPMIKAAVLIAPWDVSYDARAWGALAPAARTAAGAANYDDVEGRLTGVTVASLTDETVRDGPDLDLTKLAPALAARPLLVLTATRDDPDDQAAGLLAALKARRAPHLGVRRMVTDHGFNDHRIALETVVTTWLAETPGVPHPIPVRPHP